MGVEELRRADVDVRGFRKDWVTNESVPLIGIREGFRFSLWHREKIPPEIIEALHRAYPKESVPGREERRAMVPAYSLFVQGRYEEAAAEYGRAADSGGYAAASYGRGDALLEMGRYEEAARCYEEGLARDRNHPAVFLARCKALLDRGRHAEAARCYGIGIRADPTVPLAYVYMGDALAGLGRYAEAVGSYDEALEFGELAEAEALRGKAAALARQGMRAEAEGCYAAAAAADPGDARALYGRACMLRETGRGGEAAGFYEEAARSDPGFFRALYGKGIPGDLARTGAQGRLKS